MGAAIGGWFISHLGIHQLIWSGMMFALLAFFIYDYKNKIVQFECSGSQRALKYGEILKEYSRR